MFISEPKRVLYSRSDWKVIVWNTSVVRRECCSFFGRHQPVNLHLCSEAVVCVDQGENDSIGNGVPFERRPWHVLYSTCKRNKTPLRWREPADPPGHECHGPTLEIVIDVARNLLSRKFATVGKLCALVDPLQPSRKDILALALCKLEDPTR